MAHATFSMRSAMKHATLRVTVRGVRLARFRIQCAIPFIWLAAKIAGTGFAVESEQFAYADGGPAPKGWTAPSIDPEAVRDVAGPIVTGCLGGD